MFLSVRATLWLAAVVILGYFVWVYVDCMTDSTCHVRYCGNRMCGFSHKPVTQPPSPNR